MIWSERDPANVLYHWGENEHRNVLYSPPCQSHSWRVWRNTGYRKVLGLAIYFPPQGSMETQWRFRGRWQIVRMKKFERWNSSSIQDICRWNFKSKCLFLPKFQSLWSNLYTAFNTPVQVNSKLENYSNLLTSVISWRMKSCSIGIVYCK